MDEEPPTSNEQAVRQQKFASTHNATISFQNPIFQSTLDVTQLESTNLDLEASAKAEGSSKPAAHRPPDYLRRQSSMLTREIDKVFLGHVISIKTRTYINFQKFLRMMLPVVILIVMVLILVFVFRLNTTVTDSGAMNE